MPLLTLLLRRLWARLCEPGAGWLWVALLSGLATMGVLLLALWPADASPPVSPR